MTLKRILYVAARAFPVARNIVFSRLGIWPVSRISEHWLAKIPVFCVSLRTAVARQSLIARQMNDLGFTSLEFIPAVEARGLVDRDLESEGLYAELETRRFHNRRLSLNEIACSLSHAAAYRRIVESETPVALIIEDDALFVSRRLKALPRSILDNRDIVFLNSFINPSVKREWIADGLLSDAVYGGSTAAYLIKLEAARQLLDVAVPVVHAADGLLGRTLASAIHDPLPFAPAGSTPLQLLAAIVSPDAVLNGSVEHYHLTEIPRATLELGSGALQAHRADGSQAG